MSCHAHLHEVYQVLGWILEILAQHLAWGLVPLPSLHSAEGSVKKNVRLYDQLHH